MPQHRTKLSWTEDDIARLKSLAGEGASVFRAAAALNRSVPSVIRVARLQGVRLARTRALKAAIRALDEQAAFTTRY